MRCPYCYGPITRIRELGKAQEENKEQARYRCLFCGADFSAKPESATIQNLQQVEGISPRLQLVWPRVRG